MVEVFKTNVENPRQAEELLGIIHTRFTEYRANFDLEDCDRVLRIKSPVHIHPAALLRLLAEKGVKAQLLND